MTAARIIGRKLLGPVSLTGAMAPSPTSTFLRATWCGGGSSEVDFDGFESTFEKIIPWEDPTTVEQSGGFVFSDHPDAVSVDWSDLTAPVVVGPNHHLHRIQVPEDGLYTVIVNYYLRLYSLQSSAADPAAFADFLDIRAKIEPEGLEYTSWLVRHLVVDTQFTWSLGAYFTVELSTASPFWIVVNPRHELISGASAEVTQGPIRLRDASLSVFK